MLTLLCVKLGYAHFTLCKTDNNRCTSFPNLFIAFKIYMTVTVAPEKGGFLKLKLIKTSFEIFNQQERLNNLAFYPLNPKLAKA